MTTSNTVTKTDLTNILNQILPIAPHTAQIGQVTAFAGSTAPNGWLMCNGSAVSRTTYAKLFAVIGTTYGTGDGSTTFNLPDMRNCFPVGAGSTYSLNSKGGSKDAVVVDHIHYVKIDATNQPGWSGRVSGSGNLLKDSTYTWTDSGYVLQGNPTTGAGVTGTNKNLPPYIGLNFIIYTGTDFPPFEPDCAIYVSTSDPTSLDGNNGDVWFKYTTS